MANPSSESTPVTLALDAQGIPYRFFRHPGPVYSLEQAAQERNQRPSQIIRSILFRLSDETFVMVLVAGPSQISWPRLREFLGASRMTMASHDEVMRVTGYPTGAVSPIGISEPVRVLLDRSVVNETEISIGSGIRNTTIMMHSDDLLRSLGTLEIGDFLDNSSINPPDSD